MSTHNIGFYEDLTKIIFELSSNIIKYAAYFFCSYISLLLGMNLIKGDFCQTHLLKLLNLCTQALHKLYHT